MRGFVDWRALGAKRRGRRGWVVRSPRRRGATSWAIHVGPVDWPGETFWRVGLAVETSRSEICPLAEVDHLRCPDEPAAFVAVQWLAAAAEVDAPLFDGDAA